MILNIVTDSLIYDFRELDAESTEALIKHRISSALNAEVDIPRHVLQAVSRRTQVRFQPDPSQQDVQFYTGGIKTNPNKILHK